MGIQESTTRPERLLRIAEVEHLVALKKSAIYEGMKAGTFPHCVRLTSRWVAWRESDIVAWQKQLVRGPEPAKPRRGNRPRRVGA